MAVLSMLCLRFVVYDYIKKELLLFQDLNSRKYIAIREISRLIHKKNYNCAKMYELNTHIKIKK